MTVKQTAAGVIVEAINALQGIYEGVSMVESAPPLDQYPAYIEDRQCPLVLTTMAEGSQFSLRCRDDRVMLNLRTSVYVAPFGLEKYSITETQVAMLLQAFLNRLRDKRSYVYEDDSRRLNDQYGLAINTEVMATSDGYTVPEYPLGSERFFHGFVINLSLVGRSNIPGDC